MRKIKKNKIFILFFTIIFFLIIIFNFNLLKNIYYGVIGNYKFIFKKYGIAIFYFSNINSKYYILKHNNYVISLDLLSIYLNIKALKSAGKIIKDLNHSKFSTKKEKIQFLLLKGIYYFLLNDFENSFKSFKKVLILEPKNKIAKINLEFLLKVQRETTSSNRIKNSKKNKKSLFENIEEKIYINYESNGYKNYKNFLDKNYKEKDENYW